MSCTSSLSSRNTHSRAVLSLALLAALAAAACGDQTAAAPLVVSDVSPGGANAWDVWLP